ncbi:MAG: hypothetical protein IK005_05235 [Paludibacteraceae bacterium]|nr:hypothetical protein [Paludibacteraceae bacterium]
MNILETFLSTVPLFVKLYVVALVLAAFSSLWVSKKRPWDWDWVLVAVVFGAIAFLSLIPVLGVYSYYKEYKVLFYLISVLCLILWTPSLLCLLRGLSKFPTVLLGVAWIAVPFLLAHFLFDESVGNYFGLALCLSGCLSINIIAAWFWTAKFSCGGV